MTILYTKTQQEHKYVCVINPGSFNYHLYIITQQCAEFAHAHAHTAPRTGQCKWLLCKFPSRLRKHGHNVHIP